MKQVQVAVLTADHLVFERLGVGLKQTDEVGIVAHDAGELDHGPIREGLVVQGLDPLTWSPTGTSSGAKDSRRNCLPDDSLVLQ